MENDINAIVPSVTVAHATESVSARLTAVDKLHSVVLSAQVANVLDGDGDLGYLSGIRLTVDHDSLEPFAEALLEMIRRRKARIEALPTFTAGYIDHPAFLNQRLEVVDRDGRSVALGFRSTLAEDFDFIGEEPDKDIDGRPIFIVRRKI